MKARDVVAGWPRGRSTVSMQGDRLWSLAFRVYQWSVEDLEKILEEMHDDLRYHREQAQMMHEYRTKTGRFKLNDTDFKIVGVFRQH